jgi:Skp family chaperone for outer membrane proteins
MARITIQSLQHDLQQAQEEIRTLSKKLESEIQTKKWAQEGRDRADRELEDAHTLLDALNSPLGRTTKQEYGEKKNELHLRVAAWLVAKAGL